MGIMVYSSFWVIQDLYPQPYYFETPHHMSLFFANLSAVDPTELRGL